MTSDELIDFARRMQERAEAMMPRNLAAEMLIDSMRPAGLLSGAANVQELLTSRSVLRSLQVAAGVEEHPGHAAAASLGIDFARSGLDVFRSTLGDAAVDQILNQTREFERYTRSYDDFFRDQERVARTLSNELRLDSSAARAVAEYTVTLSEAMLDDIDTEEDLDLSDEEEFSDGHIDLVTPDRAIICVTAAITRALIEKFSEHPDEIRDLAPRRFEELIAELFDGFGYQVELTKPTRDGGYDVVAIKHHEVAVRYLIECKRWTTRPVGIGIVQRLHGVVSSEGATKGIVATTSHFSKDAMRFVELNQWQLEGSDFDGVMTWVNNYVALHRPKKKQS